MRITILNSDGHDPPGSFVIIDNHGIMVDLRASAGVLGDPSVQRITWGPVLEGEAGFRDRGEVFRREGVPQQTSLQRFYDIAELQPAIDAHRAKVGSS